MPLNTVQTIIKNRLNGLELPMPGQMLRSYINPPDPGNGMEPAAYVWGSIAEDVRRSAPRGQGFRVINHEVDIWLIWFGSSNCGDDTDFPSVIDAVCQSLRTIEMPILNAKDPKTGQNSNIEMIGERLRWDYSPVHSVEDQRFLVYTARVICDVKEQLQA